MSAMRTYIVTRFAMQSLMQKVRIGSKIYTAECLKHLEKRITDRLQGKFYLQIWTKLATHEENP